MMETRVLLCGMGGYGENYVKEYLERDVLGSSLVGIADPFAQKSPLYEQVIARGIPIYDSMDSFYEQDRADLVIISSPIHTHYPYVMSALDHGSNVLTEKPVCFDPKQFANMLDRRGRRDCLWQSDISSASQRMFLRSSVTSWTVSTESLSG
ncbi:MAG: Gfo/Idh/MocA family oxidoreductase [Spirochaetales bacterium]|nr:Gfo/Idh/MocA family oxidoreductase [Spirochaetales bacterium]